MGYIFFLFPVSPLRFVVHLLVDIRPGSVGGGKRGGGGGGGGGSGSGE
jgi:hypothetical protein